VAALASAAEIPPGGEGVIKATINTRGRSGQITKTVTVETSDPDNETVRLMLKGSILVEAALEPRSLNIGRIGKGETVTKSAKLVARDPAKVKLTKVEVVEPADGLSAKLVPGEGGDAVEVTFKAAKIGPVRSRLKVLTSSDKRPELELPIYGMVLGNWELTPRTVSFAAPEEAAATEPAKAVLKIAARNKTPFRVTKAVDAEGNVTTKVSKTPEGFEIALTLSKVPEKRQGVVTITTNDPDEPTIEARYFIRRTRPGGLSPHPVKSLPHDFAAPSGPQKGPLRPRPALPPPPTE
jgi:hypothetical protein